MVLEEHFLKVNVGLTLTSPTPIIVAKEPSTIDFFLLQRST